MPHILIRVNVSSFSFVLVPTLMPTQTAVPLRCASLLRKMLQMLHAFCYNMALILSFGVVAEDQKSTTITTKVIFHPLAYIDLADIPRFIIVLTTMQPILHKFC